MYDSGMVWVQKLSRQTCREKEKNFQTIAQAGTT